MIMVTSNKEKSTEHIHLLLTAREKAIIILASREAHFVSVSQWIRFVLLNEAKKMKIV